jgi:hypothetical protein
MESLGAASIESGGLPADDDKELYPDIELINFLKKCLVEYELSRDNISQIINVSFKEAPSTAISNLEPRGVDTRNIVNPFPAEGSSGMAMGAGSAPTQ